jgi:hypothetical protein
VEVDGGVAVRGLQEQRIPHGQRPHGAPLEDAVLVAAALVVDSLEGLHAVGPRPPRSAPPGAEGREPARVAPDGGGARQLVDGFRARVHHRVVARDRNHRARHEQRLREKAPARPTRGRVRERLAVDAVHEGEAARLHFVVDARRRL